MNITVGGWGLTLLGLLALILVDLWIVDRGEPRDFTLRQAGAWVGCYVLLAVAFGVGLLVFAGLGSSTQFFAGYLTEYSLSIDNLFIFYVVMARFAVPRANQHKVLLIGILIALLLRGVFIAVGAAALAEFEWLFYLFGAFLIWTAIGLVRRAPDEDEFEDNILVRWVCRVIPSTDDYHGHRMTARVGGRRVITPMLIVMIAIGSTDLLFALDSIPAIFGLTKRPYLVFTSNAFALMGLRQLYFLLRGLLDRLVYLSQGLAVILAFIGVKLVLEAMHTTWFGQVPEISTGLSLIVIGVTMVLTTVASLVKARRGGPRTADAAGSGASGPGLPAAPAGEESATGWPEAAEGGAGVPGAARPDAPEPHGDGGVTGRPGEAPAAVPGRGHTPPPGPRTPADTAGTPDDPEAADGDAAPSTGDADPAGYPDQLGRADRTRR